MPQYTPVRPSRGGLTHAVLIAGGPEVTACGRAFGGRGWAVSLGRVTCRRCKLALSDDAEGVEA